MTNIENTVTIRPRPGGAWNVVLWVLQCLAAFAFIMAGFAKLSGRPMMVEEFARLGLGQWFRYVTGALEWAGAAALLVPALSGVGGMLLSCVMVGAVAATS